MIKEKIQNSKVGKILAKVNCGWLACKGKISARLGALEDNYNFPFSHIVWHVFSVVAILVGVAGLLLFLWGLTPVFKDSVDEPDYLSQRNITEAEVLDCAKTAPPPRKVVQKRTETGEVVEAEEPPEISLEKLQAALPGITFQKNGRKLICDYSEGHYEYEYYGDWVYPSRCYVKGLVDTYEATKIRKMLQEAFPYDSASQQNSADHMALHLTNYQVASRVSIYRTSFDWFAGTSQRAAVISQWSAIDQVIGNSADAAKTDAVEKVFYQIYDFMSHNPKSGPEVLPKALEILSVAHGLIRLDVFKTARQGFKTLDMEVDEWNKASSQYLGMPSLHAADKMVSTLKCFYELYANEAIERLRTNQKLEREYKDELEKAEKDAEHRGQVKTEMRPTGMMMIGAGIAVILVIAILLVLFSMQRTLVRMEKAFTEKK